MYFNLNAEMARKKIKQSDICNILGLGSSAVNEKMNGKSDFKLKECKKIIKILFPKLTIEYLFKC